MEHRGLDLALASQRDESRYRLLIEAIKDYAIYMIDPNGIVTSWNPGAERLKGYTQDEIIGRHFSNFYTEGDRLAGLPERALATAAAEGKFESESWRVRKDGGRFWASVVIDPIRSPEGELIGFAKITRDLTERKAAEAELRKSQEQFSLLVQSVTDYAIYMLNPDGVVISWNKGAERIKGYTRDEIVGEHFSRFYTPEDRAAGEPQRALATARRDGRFEKQGVRIRKDGTRFIANVIIDVIHNEAGEMIGFAKITRDVTAWNDNQRALEQAREALFQAQKMDAIGQLTGGVAHDFNNLLTAILGSLQLLRKRLPDDDRSLALLDNAVQGAKRGATLTQRLLAFARRQAMSSRPIDVPQLVTGMADLLQRTLGSSIAIETAFPAILPAVLSDPNQLELAILNLCVNSRDAMPEGGRIRITADMETTTADRDDMKPGRYLRLSIIDSGEGMDEETQRRALEPFFTTKGVGKGTGLGLSMVHGFVRQSGGALAIESEAGVGTSVIMTLPVAEGMPHAEPAAERSLPTTAVVAQSPLLILAVDDDGLVLMNTALMLQDLGHRVLEASSGEAALHMLRDNPEIDLVITDHNMPGMTGSQLAEAIQLQKPGTKILIATGYAELPSGEATTLPRLSKPFTQDELAASITAIRAPGPH